MVVGALVATVAFAGQDDVRDGVAVAAATVGGQLALGIGGGAAGLAWGNSICASQGGNCMAPLMAIPLAGLGLVVGAPVGAGIGAHMTDRRPWRTVGFVGATQLGCIAIAVGGGVLAASGSEELGVGMLYASGVGGLVLPSVAAGIGATSGPDDRHLAVLPELGKDRMGVRVVASF